MPVKPSEAEEEYFARQEFERRRRDAEQRAERLAAEEKARLKELHWMRCPKCGMELAEIEFQGLKIDRCTGCAGEWLDPGELDALAKNEPGGVLSRLSRALGRR